MGNRFVVELEFGNKSGMLNENVSYYNLVGANDRAPLLDAEVERAAAAYAAKAAPAPVSTAWEPKRDEVVLVEMEFVREKAGGEVYVQKGDGNFIAVPRSAIVGPAPVRARFAVGDVVVHRPSMELVKVTQVDDNAWCWVTNGHTPVGRAAQTDLIPVDEARERLERNA